MPIYEYECERTGKQFEVEQRMSDEPLTACPECGGPAHRLIAGGAAVIFKGSGFHATDYRNHSAFAPSCGRDRPCCGRDVPCETSPRND